MNGRPFIAAALFLCATMAAIPSRAAAATGLEVKLPYGKGQSFVVAQGYGALPTHIKKDAYALDLTQNGCDVYGKPAVAAAAGTVMFVSEEGYNGGYGTEIILSHGNNRVSRYAHLVAGSVVPVEGAVVRQGEAIGRIGDTGLVIGMACAAHPGTHLHFAMDGVDPDGTFSALDPEPISGYNGMTEGRWYMSDNGDEGTSGDILGASITVPAPMMVATTTTATTTAAVASSTNTATATFTFPTVTFASGGSSLPPPPATEADPVPPAVTSTPDAAASSSSPGMRRPLS